MSPRGEGNGGDNLTRIKENFTRYIVSTTGDIFDSQTQSEVKQFHSNKYLQCRLIDDEGSVHIMGVHSVVAMFHLETWKPGCVVHHKDGNTRNNQVSNLECLDRRSHARLHANPENLRKAIKNRGPWNKGKKMSSEFCRRCSESAKKRRKKTGA